MSTVTLPKTLVPNTPARAADVMADLNAIIAEVNGNLNLENLTESIKSALLPSGSVVATARATAPSGFLLCQGQAVSRTTYATLFAAIGTTFGPGDGVTSFNVPDLRGRVALGPDAGTERLGPAPGFGALGQAGGGYALQFHDHGIGSLHTSAESAAHQHLLPMFNSTRHEGSGTAWQAWNAGGSAEYTATESALHGHFIEGRVEGVGLGNWQNLQPYQVLNWMIKT